VSLLERGLKSPTLRTVFGIAEVLGERRFELVKRAEEILTLLAKHPVLLAEVIDHLQLRSGIRRPLSPRAELSGHR